MVPSGAAWKRFIKDVTRSINSWIENSPLKLVPVKAMNIMPSLLLQNPSKMSKTKDHISALDKRLRLYKEAKFGNLFYKAKTIQNSFKIIFNSCDIALRIH